MRVAEAKSAGNGDWISHQLEENKRCLFLSLVPGNTVDSVIKQGRAREEQTSEKRNNQFVSDMLSLSSILVLPGQSPSLNSGELQ